MIRKIVTIFIVTPCYATCRAFPDSDVRGVVGHITWGVVGQSVGVVISRGGEASAVKYE